MPSVDITYQPTVVEATNDTSVVSFSETQVTVEVPSPTPVVEFASAATLVPGAGLTGGGYLLGNVPIGLSAASVASLLKADTAVQPGANLSGFVDDVGLATDAEVAAAIAGLGAVYQPVNSNLTAIASQSTTVFGRSFLDLADAAASRTLIGVYSTSQVYTKSEVNALVAAGLIPVWGTITGNILDQADLQLALSARSSIGHAHAWGEITGKPTTFTPSAHVHAAADITSGVIAPARLGTGTADATTYLRGDGTWATITGGVTDHGGLTGLGDDDHTQYFNQTRGDARYSLLGHTHSYLPLAGGTLTGELVLSLGGAGTSAARLASMPMGDGNFALHAWNGRGSTIDSEAASIGLAYAGTRVASLNFFRGGAANAILAQIEVNGNVGFQTDGTNIYEGGTALSSKYLTLSGGTLTGNVQIYKQNPVLILRDSVDTGALQMGYISLQDAAGAETGWMGMGSDGNTNLSLANSIGKIVLSGTSVDLTASTTVNGAIYSVGSDATLWFNSRSGNGANWAWYSQTGSAALYRSGVGDALTVDAGGNMSLIGGLFPSGRLAWNTETFTFDGDTIPHYGLTWYADSRNAGGNSLAIAGYGGITFFAQGVERARFDYSKARFETEIHTAQHVRVYGGYVYGPSDKEVLRLDDSWLRLNQSNSFTSGVYTPNNFRVDGVTSLLGQINGGLDGTRHVLFSDGSSIQRYYTDNTPTALHEWYIDMGTVVRPIYLRFHQGGRWYNRLKAESNLLSYVGGVDEILGGAQFAFLRLNGAGSHLTMWESDGTDPNDRGILEVNGGLLQFYTHDSSANVWHNPFNADITTGLTTIGSNSYYGSAVRIRSVYGYGDFGPANASWFHMSTNMPAFYMGNALHVNGSIYRYGTNYAMDSDGFYFDASANRIRATSGSYGTGELYGSKNGWAGIRSVSASGAPYLMFSTTGVTGGIYSESDGWRLYFNGTQWEAYGAAMPITNWGNRCVMSRGTAAPSGGSNGDIYFQYT